MFSLNLTSQSQNLLYFIFIIINYWYIYLFEFVKFTQDNQLEMFRFLKQKKSCNCVQPETKQFNSIKLGQVFNKCKSIKIFVIGQLYKVVFFLSKSLKCNKKQSRTLNSETSFFFFVSQPLEENTIDLQKPIEKYFVRFLPFFFF